MKKIILVLVMFCSIILITGCKPKEYTVTLKYEDGTIFKEVIVEKKATINLETPSKDGYTFIGWYDGETKVDGSNGFTADTVLVAKFDINSYTYKFIVDGNIIKEETATYGTTIEFPETPCKDGTQEFSYTFKEWDNSVTTLLKDEVFNAVFESSTNQYTYKFLDANGTVIKEETLEYGSEIVYPDDPTKEATAEYTYTFTGWDNDATVLIENVVFNPVYSETKNQYTYKFVDDAGKVLKEEKVDYGTLPIAPEDPEKAKTQEYTYTFTGWDKEIKVVTDNITYKATYAKEKNQYTYKFVDEDGKILKEEKVDYGTLPVAPDDPIKEGTSEIKYNFVGWDKDITKVVQDVIYTAVYEEELIKEEITSLDGLKISFLGDSISTFYAEGSEMNSYYSGTDEFFYPKYSHSIKTVDLTWWYKLIKNNNMVLGVNNSWSGSQACGTSNSAGQSDYRINTIDENGDPDIVIVYLGTNDLGSNRTISDLEKAITNIINKISARCDAQIFLTTLGYSAYKGGSYTDENRVLYNAKLRELATKYECGIVPLDEYVVNDNYMIYLEDSLHYNAKGANLLSLIAEKALKDYYNISFDKEIVVEHQEPLPEGATGVITATTDSNFWGAYETGVFLVPSTFDNPTFSLRIEITKNTDNGKYYVTKIQKSGESTPYACDYVLVISDSHKEATALKKLLEKVEVGNIVEFDESITFPVELTFKEGDGNVVTPPVEEPDPEVNPPVEGQLHVGSYNTGVWTVYDKTVIAFSHDAMDTASTYINFYVIKLTYDEASNKYKITDLKTVDVACDFSECDYYILIYRDLPEKTYFENAQIGNYVTMNGDVTTGSCNLLFE